MSARVRAGFTCGSAASVTRSRNGISFTISPDIIDRPSGSCTISRSGGRSQPVSSGEINRANMPEGAMRKASAKALAACGRESSGEIRCWMRAKSRVPPHAAVNSITAVREMAAVTSPVTRLISADMRIAGSANSMAKGASPNSIPPSAGR
ncbi:hypothetical protein [Nitratireductor aquibiodomus]|uniref:hypothetical protein n=1 Tax=Nitratireductor aquibiodomus TaxID=204799 RepID=UPI002FDD84E7